MSKIIYFRDFLVLVGGVTLITLSFDAYNFLFPSTPESQKDLFDWSVVGEYPNHDNSVVAVLEHGVSNTRANTAPFYHVKLQAVEDPSEWLHHWLVWNSQVYQPPRIKWVDQHNIEIEQISSTVWDYKPTVELNGESYGVHLNVLPIKP